MNRQNVTPRAGNRQAGPIARLEAPIIQRLRGVRDNVIRAELIETIRAANRIGDVASECVALRRCGMQLRGRCPFHSERTPSLYIHPDKGVFHCHGCGVGGDVFEFAKRQLNCSFPEAVKFLAQRTGIDIEGFRPSPEMRRRAERQRLAREREKAFMVFANAQYEVLAAQHRSLGRTAVLAADYLRPRFLAGDNPTSKDDAAWEAIAALHSFEMKIEREELYEPATTRRDFEFRSRSVA